MKQSSTVSKEDIQLLRDDLKKLVNTNKKQTSIRFIIISSTLRGLFTALGATIIFATAVFFADFIISKLQKIPIFDKILDRIEIHYLLDSTKPK